MSNSEGLLDRCWVMELERHPSRFMNELPQVLDQLYRRGKLFPEQHQCKRRLTPSQLLEIVRARQILIRYDRCKLFGRGRV